MQKYLEKVIERLHLKSDIDIKFLYTEDQINDNIDYIDWCERNGLSPYKCLTFLDDYIRGDYNVSNDIKQYKRDLKLKNLGL